MSILTGAQELTRSLPRVASGRSPGTQPRPQRLVLDVVDGVAPSSKPPVRIFIGTEPAQYLAERVLVWSIEKLRDPSRVYEIHLMNELAGFNRFGWLTGFTNYRFAIPHFAGGSGRAIWNDVDQVYLADPAELFDLDMGDRGLLAVSPHGRLDTSVMLIDCERMAPVWSLEGARRERKNALLAKVKAVPGLHGPLAPEWNARDGEYVEGHSKVLHFTALHTQPWRPFPRRFFYQRNAVGRVWFDLKQAADDAGYQIFTFARPSASFSDLVERFRITRDRANRPPPTAPSATLENGDLSGLVAAVGARSLLEFGIGTGANGHAPSGGIASLFPDRKITCFDPTAPPLAEPPAASFDGVVCREGLEFLGEQDATWVIEELFRYAERFLFVAVTDVPRTLADGTELRTRPHDPSWWFALFAECGLRHPGVHWRVVLDTAGANGERTTYVRGGGRCLDGPPKVWVLTDGKPGHTTQSIGLAEALGWPYEIKDLNFTAIAGLGNLFMGDLGASRQGIDRSRSVALEPPWPDVVISTGWRPAPVARWIGKQSRGRTRLVQLGRKGGRAADLFDVVIACTYFRLPSHPRRIETTTPLNQVSKQQLAEAAARWPNLFGEAPRPHIALVVGGSSRRHYFSAEAARRMGQEVRTFAEEAGGSVFAITSRRTGDAATEALIEGLGPSAHLHRWQPGRKDNPYLAYLVKADALVVTGESESMLAEAAATGKPVYIYPVTARPPGLWTRFEDWVVARAHARPRNRRGTTRPQRGLERLCARLIARGIVQPKRDVHGLHQILIDRGLAQPFGAPYRSDTRPPLHEADEVAGKVRRLLGFVEP